MSKIGILTIHRVYNYGAAVQAYSLQRFLSDHGYTSEIIDFSKKKQNDYTNVISIHNGGKRFIKTLILTPVLRDRLERKRRFDTFFDNRMVLSPKKYEIESSLMDANKQYSVFIIGSDQVWNVKKDSDFTSAYLLDFAGDDKRKISYASSVGISDFDDLKNYRDLLRRFDALSCREAGGSKILSEITGRTVTQVLDPTLLVAKESLLQLTRKTNNEPYILYYSLDGYDKKDNNLDILKYLTDCYSLELKIITPEWPFHKFGTDVRDAGPEDFLTLIRNAAMVCTNSFHGTALSIKFETPVYVLESKNIKDERKRSILEQLGAEDRIVSTVKDLRKTKSFEMDYQTITRRLEELRNLSEDYLFSALKGEDYGQK